MEQIINQPTLAAGILTWLQEMGVDDINIRQLNAVIKAADDIIKELAKPTTLAHAGMGLTAWLMSDDTGASSKYMASVLAKAVGKRTPFVDNHHPWDADDFGRCVRLLDAVPEFRPHVKTLANPEHGPIWNMIAAEWDTLEAWYREDLPTGKSQRLTDRLRTIASLGEAA